MKSIDLVKCSSQLFASDLEHSSYRFFTNNEPLYRDIWKSQGNNFWLKFVLSLRSEAYKELHSCPDTYDWIFVDLLKKLCDKRFCKLSQHIRNVALIIGCNNHFDNLEAFISAQNPDIQRGVRKAIHIIYGEEKNRKQISESKLQHHYSLTMKCVAAFLKFFYVWTCAELGERVRWQRPDYWGKSGLQVHPMELYLAARFGGDLPGMLGCSKSDLEWCESLRMTEQGKDQSSDMAVNLKISCDSGQMIKLR